MDESDGVPVTEDDGVAVTESDGVPERDGDGVLVCDDVCVRVFVADGVFVAVPVTEPEGDDISVAHNCTDGYDVSMTCVPVTMITFALGAVTHTHPCTRTWM